MQNIAVDVANFDISTFGDPMVSIYIISYSLRLTYYDIVP